MISSMLFSYLSSYAKFIIDIKLVGGVPCFIYAVKLFDFFFFFKLRFRKDVVHKINFKII